MFRSSQGMMAIGVWLVLGCAVWLVLGCAGTVVAGEPSLNLAPPATDEHPLAPVLRFAREGLERIDREIRDYECVLIKRERVDAELLPYQYMRLKVRHAQQGPDEQATTFAVFARFLGPEIVEGREVLYVDGQRDGYLLARRGGSRLPNLTLELDPRGRLAMTDNRYPITEVGIRNLVVRLVEAVEQEMQRDGCEVHYFRDAKIDGRPCRHVQVKFAEPDDARGFAMARVFIDEELALPVYYAAYSWPEQAGDPPVLEEEYVYTQLRLNPGFSDEEFTSTYPDYNFQRARSEREADELARND